MTHQIPRPYDFHVHLRDGDMLRRVLLHTSDHFAGALVMPNTTKPILTVDDARAYEKFIQDSFNQGQIGRFSPIHVPNFSPLMTIKLTKTTTPEIVRACQGVVTAGKFYPEGMTTNSADGVKNVRDLYPVFEAMQDIDMVLCLHGETPDVFCMDREKAFLRDLKDIATLFPKLRIVLEHITTVDAVEAVLTLPANVAATITVHHMLLTLDDVIGDMLRPHHFCKPIAKRPHDRDMLSYVARCGNPKVFLGTDSAPHLVERKECAHGCAGVFTAPVAMSLLAEMFEGFEESLARFTSLNGCAFYKIEPSQDQVVIQEESWTVPTSYNGVVPLYAGKTLKYKVLPSALA